MKRLVPLLLIIALIFSFAGCAMEDTGILPPLQDFSSEEYQIYAEMFPPVQAATFRAKGSEEMVSPEDPRLIQLINLLAFSWAWEFDAYSQDPILDAGITQTLAMDLPVLEITFQVGAVPPEGVSYFSAKQMVVCANAYLLIGNEQDICEQYNTSRYADLRFPYCQQVSVHADASQMYWGNAQWIDMLKEVGFYK